MKAQLDVHENQLKVKEEEEKVRQADIESLKKAHEEELKKKESSNVPQQSD